MATTTTAPVGTDETSTATSPTIQSPAVDRLWTANSRVLDGEDLRRIGDGGYALGARGAQIRDALQAKARFGERDLLSIQLDDRALLLQPWHALLLERAKASRTPALQALATASATWEGRASVDSVSFSSGSIQMLLQDGSSRSFGPGEHFYSADTLPAGASFDPTVHGHWSRQVGDEPLVTLFVRG